MKYLQFDFRSPSSLKRLAIWVALFITGLQIVLLLLAATSWQRVVINDCMAPVATLFAFEGWYMALFGQRDCHLACA